MAEPENIYIVNPTTGKRGYIPASELSSWAQAGYQAETPEGTENARLEEEYGDSPIQAGLEGAARGATLGLSDALIGQLDPEGFRERRERNPIAATVGEVGGAVVGSLVGAAPAGLATRAGIQAEKTTVTALAGAAQASKAAQRYAPAIVRGGAEGAIFGAGSGVSTVALSEDPISAEAALAEIGTQALLGFAIGAPLGGAGKFLEDSAAYARDHVRAITRPTIADDVIAAAPQTSDDLARIAKQPPKGMKKETRAALEAEKAALGGAVRDVVPGTLDDIPPGFRPFTEAESAKAANLPVAKGLPRPETLAPDGLYVVPVDDLERAGLWTDVALVGDEVPQLGVIDDLWKKGEKLPPVELSMDDQGRMFIVEGNHRLRVALDEGVNRPVLARITPLSHGSVTDDATRMQAKAAQAAPDVVDDFKAKYHKQDTASRQQIRQMESMEKRGVVISDEMRQAADELEQARREMRKFMPLEPERSYESLLDKDLGGSYAKGQGKSLQTWIGSNEDIAKAVMKPGFTDALRTHQQAMDNMQALLGNKAYPPVIGMDHGIFTPLAQSKPDPAALARANADVAKLERINKALEASPAAAKQKWYEEIVTMAEQRGMVAPDDVLLAKMREAGLDGLSPSDVPAEELSRLKGEIYREQLRSQAASARASKVKAKKPQSALDELLGNTIAEKVATGIGAAAGQLTGIGSFAGGAIGRFVLGNPLRKITEGLSGRIGGHLAKVAKGVDVFLSGAQKASRGTPRLTGAILSAANFGLTESDEKPKGTPFEQRSAELSKVIANEQETKQRLHDALSGVRMADPFLGDQMEVRAWERLQYLYDKMPKDPGVGSLLNKRQKWHPSDAEIAKWARCVDASEHPEHVLEDMAKGMVTMEAVEAMQALYPEMYAMIQSDIVLKAAELQKDLDWEQRLTLSVMFGAPTDGVLRPEAIQAMQMTFVPEEPEQQPSVPQGQVKPQEATPAQRFASGMGA